MYQAPQAPLSVAGVLDDGLSLFRAGFKDAFPIAFGAAVLSAPWSRYLWSALSTRLSAVPVLLSLAVLAALALISTGAVIARIAAVAGGGRLSLAAALGLASRRLPAVLGTAVLASFAIVVGLLALIAPAVYLAVALMFGVVAAVVERTGPVASLKRSDELVRGSWGHAAGAATLIGIVPIVRLLVSLAMSAEWLPSAVATGRVSSPWLLDYLVDPLISGVLGPLLYSLLVALYYDLARRGERGRASRPSPTPVLESSVGSSPRETI